MIRTVLTGNLLDSGAQTLVNTVNCVGVMGKGIALDFKRRFPEMYRDYVVRCQAGSVRLGEPYLYTDLGTPWILNFPTKQHWRQPSEFASIDAGLHVLAAQVRAWGVTSLAVPPLGCGNGWLDWNVMGPVLYRSLEALPVPVDLYAPFGTPAAQLTLEFLERIDAMPNAVPVSHIALIEVIAQLNAAPFRPVGQTLAMQLCQAATTAGLPTGFTFQRGEYGPFSREAKTAFARLANNGLLEMQQQDRLREVRPGPTFADARRTYAAELAALQPVIERLTDLFLHVAHSTQLAELATTLMFVADELAAMQQAPIADSMIQAAVIEWKGEKFSADLIAEQMQVLEKIGWLSASAVPLPVE